LRYFGFNRAAAGVTAFSFIAAGLASFE